MSGILVLEYIIKYGHQLAVRLVKDKIQKVNRAEKWPIFSDDEVELSGQMKDNPQKDTFWDNQNQAKMTAGD